MTTSHKIVLSLVAAICITLIVFYSVQGNAQNRGPSPVAMVTSPSPTTGAPVIDGATPPAGKAMQTPVIVGRAENPQGTGLDDLVARVRTELATNETPATGGSTPTVTTTEPLASANVPATTPVVPPAPVSEVSVTQPAPVNTTEATTEAAKPITPTTPAAPSANAVAEVPSFTLGEPAADLPSPGGAAAAKEDRPKLPYDVNLRDIADMPILEEPLPPLVRVRSNDEASAKSDAPVETKKETTTSDKTQTPPVVIVVDPHKPAVKVDEPAVTTTESKASDTKTEAKATPEKTKDVELALNEVKTATNPAANTTAKAPPVEPVKTTPPATSGAAAKTYTIKAGDSFSSIATAVFGAEKHWIDIADANPGVDPKRVRVGQVINLPVIDKDEKTEKTEAKATAPAPAVKTEPAKPTATAEDVKIHEVKAGENLTNISRKHFNTPDHWRHIYLTNRELIGGDPSKLQAGTKLKITTPPKSN